MVSSGESGLPDKLRELLSYLEKQIHIEVMVTLTCLYCPRAVHAARKDVDFLLIAKDLGGRSPIQLKRSGTPRLR